MRREHWRHSRQLRRLQGLQLDQPAHTRVPRVPVHKSVHWSPQHGREPGRRTMGTPASSKVASSRRKSAREAEFIVPSSQVECTRADVSDQTTSAEMSYVFSLSTLSFVSPALAQRSRISTNCFSVASGCTLMSTVASVSKLAAEIRYSWIRSSLTILMPIHI